MFLFIYLLIPNYITPKCLPSKLCAISSFSLCSEIYLMWKSIHSATSSKSRETKQSSKWNLPWDAPANSTLCFKNHMSSPTLLMLNLLLCSFISGLNSMKQTFDVFNIWKHLWVRILNHSMDFSQFIGNLTCNWLHYSEKNPIVYWLIPTLGKIKTHDLHSGEILHHGNCLSRDIIYLSMSSCKTCRTEQ